MSQLPLTKVSDPGLSAMLTRWKSILDVLLALPLSDSNLLIDIPLINGATVINHKLGRKMRGWIITDIDGAASIYRSAALNNMTLTLTSNAAVTVSIEVF